jgi:hypothetical protein
VTGSSTEAPGEQPPERDPWALTVKWITLLAAVSVLVFALLLLPYIWHPEPVAAPFTRVGGATNVETAVDASRFWLTSPQVIVETSANATPSIMLGAAQCAMVHGAPLLFTSQDPKRQLLVDEAFDAWNNPPPPIIIQSPGDVTRCLEMTTDRVPVNGLSTLAGPYSLVQLPKPPPEIPLQRKLNSTVVFAAALGPGFLPDVAVGMALAAHMAAHNPVSLVIVPRYLEADPGFESQLESQNEVVNGVVLGQAVTIPEDTRALLRQLLTSTNRQDLFAQIQAALGSVGPVAAALLALIGAGAAASAGRRLIDEVRKPTSKPPERTKPPKRTRPPKRTKRRTLLKRTRQLQLRVGSFIVSFIGERPGGPKAPSPVPLWRTAVDENQAAQGENQEVTVWLRSGTKVVGIVGKWFPSDVKQGKGGANALVSAVLQLDEVTLTRPGDDAETVECKFVLVPAEDIELIAKVSPDQGH